MPLLPVSEELHMLRNFRQALIAQDEAQIKKLVEVVDINIIDPLDWSHTALHMASMYYGKSWVVERLLYRGADPNAMNTYFLYTPIFWAANYGFNEIISTLVDHGADIHRTDRIKANALYAPCIKNLTSTVQLLLEKGLDPFLQNSHHQSALGIALSNGHNETVSHILKLCNDPAIIEAEVNRKDSEGNTLLHHAAHAGSIALITQLLDAGAKITRNKSGLTPEQMTPSTENGRASIKLIQTQINKRLNTMHENWNTFFSLRLTSTAQEEFNNAHLNVRATPRQSS